MFVVTPPCPRNHIIVTNNDIVIFVFHPETKKGSGGRFGKPANFYGQFYPRVYRIRYY